MNSLTILQSAPRMQLQDLGRFGYAHTGLSQGGPIDLHAHCWANRLLENKPHATTLEISYGNCLFKANSNCSIAITGAEMNAQIDGVALQNWSTHFIRKGQILQLHYATKGIHAYLAIQQGFQTPPVLGSSATVIRNQIGSLLKENSNLEFIHHATPEKTSKRIPAQYIPDYDIAKNIRVILPIDQDADLSEKLIKNQFTISQKSDRMGINLIAAQPLPSQPGIISEGISLGAIQLPPSGNPIILLNDRQTQGGYKKIGAIARVDLPLLVQTRPGTSITLGPISRDQAAQEWTEFTQFFQPLQKGE